MVFVEGSKDLELTGKTSGKIQGSGRKSLILPHSSRESMMCLVELIKDVIGS